jgi:hypothetical protein
MKIIENIIENSFLVTINTWTMKIHDAIDRRVRTNYLVVDAQCVQAIIDGLRASSDKSRSTRYLYDKAKALSDTERPKTLDWVVTTMRNVKVALETANLNGFVYDASFQLHHKKPGTSVMHCDLKKVGGGGKTAQKPTSAAAPSLCNICGGNHTMDACRQKGFPDTNPDVSVKWSDSAVGKAWKDRHDCNWRPGGSTITLENYVKQGEQVKKKARNSPASSGLRKPNKSLVSSCACLNCQQVMLAEMCGAQRASPTSSLTDSPSIVQIRFNHTTEPLTFVLKSNYASERVAAWCRERFPRKIGDTVSGRVCLPVASTCTASKTTLSSVSVYVFDDFVNKSMLLDFRILPFQSNVGYDVILAIDTLIKHQLLWTTFRHRFITQSEPATPIDLLAAHISTAEAYNVEGDVREVNIPTFEPDLSTSFRRPCQTYRHRSTDRLIFNQQSNNYVWILRTYSAAKSRASQPESNP